MESSDKEYIKNIIFSRWSELALGDDEKHIQFAQEILEELIYIHGIESNMAKELVIEAIEEIIQMGNKGIKESVEKQLNK